MPRKPSANISAVANHCVVSTFVKPSWSNQRNSVYSDAKTKNAAISAARITSETPTILREVRGAAGFGDEVEVTVPS